MAIYLPDEKKCENECPNCGADIHNIDWGTREYEADGMPYQEATCKKCGCYFREYYKYDITVYNKR